MVFATEDGNSGLGDVVCRLVGELIAAAIATGNQAGAERAHLPAGRARQGVHPHRSNGALGGLLRHPAKAAPFSNSNSGRIAALTSPVRDSATGVVRSAFCRVVLEQISVVPPVVPARWPGTVVSRSADRT